MKKFLAVFMISSLFTVSAWTQTLSQFANEERAALHFQQQYNAAPSGSWEEQQARQARDVAIQRAIQSVNLYTFQGMHWTQIENFADQMNQKYNASPSGGAIEGMYRQVRDTSYAAFNQELQNFVMRFPNDWRQLHDLALQMDQKYNASSSGSQKERAYDQARRSAYSRIPQAVEQEYTRMWNFRDAERLAEYFHNLYNAASSGSLKENVYNQVRRSGYSHATSKFNQQAYQMPQYELMNIQQEYNNRYNAASSGSLQEGYYRQVRDTARSLIRPSYP